ncbi:MAG: hypothetical protein WC789_07630 [Lentisphaeria bacterium]|jgi:hypothetical protein
MSRIHPWRNGIARLLAALALGFLAAGCRTPLPPASAPTRAWPVHLAPLAVQAAAPAVQPLPPECQGLPFRMAAWQEVESALAAHPARFRPLPLPPGPATDRLLQALWRAERLPYPDELPAETFAHLGNARLLYGRVRLEPAPEQEWRAHLLLFLVEPGPERSYIPLAGSAQAADPRTAVRRAAVRLAEKLDPAPPPANPATAAAAAPAATAPPGPGR